MGLRIVNKLVLALLICLFVTSPLLKAKGEDQTLVVVNLQECALVWGKEILLGELGEVSGPSELVCLVRQVQVGTAPLFGNTRCLTRGHIEVRLRQAGIDLSLLELRGAISVQVSGMGEKLPNSQDSSSQIGPTKRVVAVTRDITRGEILLASDLQSEEREAWRVGPFENTLDDFVGQRAARHLKKGTVLTSQSVEVIPVIERGAQIRILAVTGSICASAPGTARGTGHQGDLIPVENSLSRQVVYGRIVDKDTVQVIVGRSGLP